MKKFKFDKQTDNLFGAIISLKTVKEAEMFFRDLCTIDEIKEMSDRWQIARLIDLGWPYRKISEKLRVSTTTVARVALWLNNGEGGYRLILGRLPKEHGLFPIFKRR
ncbi:MAG: YerC/YecD family TrpR-related protein [bacterium]|nr:YerC/YecD family TrpR-related protein [bacterium]